MQPLGVHRALPFAVPIFHASHASVVLVGKRVGVGWIGIAVCALFANSVCSCLVVFGVVCASFGLFCVLVCASSLLILASLSFLLAVVQVPVARTALPLLPLLRGQSRPLRQHYQVRSVTALPVDVAMFYLFCA